MMMLNDQKYYHLLKCPNPFARISLFYDMIRVHEKTGRGAKMTQSDYIVIKAKEDGVNVIGLTRGDDTKFHHTEKLDRGEVMIAQFTDHTSAMKIRGEADIHTANGVVSSEGKK